MVLETKTFKEACQTALSAIDSAEKSLFTETLELVANGQTLHLNITNREYYVSVKFNLETEEHFRAAVNAKKFLTLISKTTTDRIEIIKENERTLKVRANGTSTFEIIFNNDQLLELPAIEIENVTNSMTINSSILHSILANNRKELQRGTPVRPVQEYYYVDEKGAITFTSGACVNSFNLEKPIKILLSDKVVKLFKLFKPDTDIAFTLGQEQVSDTNIITIMNFKSNVVDLSAKFNVNGLISGVPVDAIRDRATKEYSHSIVLETSRLIEALNRVMIFNEIDTRGTITFDGTVVNIEDMNGYAKEGLFTVNEPSNTSEYTMKINLKNILLVLNGIEDEYVTMSFGDHAAVVFKKLNVTDIVPELKLS